MSTISAAAQLSAFKSHSEEKDKHTMCVVVDSGYSFTHIVPVCNGKVIRKAVRRYVEDRKSNLLIIMIHKL